MPPDWYDHTTYPSQGAAGSSSAARAEFELIESNISNKLPVLTGNGSKIVAVNSAGSALEAITGADARTAIGLAVGTDVQAYDADLAAIAALISAANKLLYATGAGTWALADLTAAGRALLGDADASAMLTTLGLSTFIKTLIDDADAATARATLGAAASGALGSSGITGAATSGANSNITSLSGLTTPLSVAQGGTGSATATSAPTMTVFTANGTYNKPAGLKAIRVRVVGGGGGANNNGTGLSGSGGGGGYSEKLILVAALAAATTVTVGTGGIVGSGPLVAGGTGGTSSFGAHCSATGGTGGSAGAGVSGIGGDGSGGDLNISGSDGHGRVITGTESFWGGSSALGGASIGTAKNYGGGGSRNVSAVITAGAGGVVIVEEFF